MNFPICSHMSIFPMKPFGISIIATVKPLSDSSNIWVLFESCAYVLSHVSCVRLLATLWTLVCQAPLSVGFSRQEYWSGSPCPPPGDLPDLGVKPTSLISPALAGEYFATSTTREAPTSITDIYIQVHNFNQILDSLRFSQVTEIALRICLVLPCLPSPSQRMIPYFSYIFFNGLSLTPRPTPTKLPIWPPPRMK